MNLTDCYIGQRVQESHILSSRRTGVIRGLVLNPEGHAIPKVELDGLSGPHRFVPIHHGNLIAVFDGWDDWSI